MLLNTSGPSFAGAAMPSGSFTVPWAYAIATERLLARRTASFDGTLTPLKPADLAVPVCCNGKRGKRGGKVSRRARCGRVTGHRAMGKKVAISHTHGDVSCPSRARAVRCVAPHDSRRSARRTRRVSARGTARATTPKIKPSARPRRHTHSPAVESARDTTLKRYRVSAGMRRTRLRWDPEWGTYPHGEMTPHPRRARTRARKRRKQPSFESTKIEARGNARLTVDEGGARRRQCIIQSVSVGWESGP